ncbi:uncharacterized protein LOC114290493 [Camellia sinensis]|uniref:uncharacterized protein LOC114290493 n=1 Tax=Camellia sinensis TaxID=4442 RepID=UPI001035BA5C|nr:uncharacterized protein LOC114290493 [Camellia sinensis]
MAALQAFNLGTVVMWDMISNLHSTSIGTEMYMNYVLWAFKPTIEGFKYCRLVICIDGTHLYRKYESKIVAATAVIAADKVIPLAFVVVDKEMIESWEFGTIQQCNQEGTIGIACDTYIAISMKDSTIQ